MASHYLRRHKLSFASQRVSSTPSLPVSHVAPPPPPNPPFCHPVILSPSSSLFVVVVVAMLGAIAPWLCVCACGDMTHDRPNLRPAMEELDRLVADRESRPLDGRFTRPHTGESSRSASQSRPSSRSKASPRHRRRRSVGTAAGSKGDDYDDDDGATDGSYDSPRSRKLASRGRRGGNSRSRPGSSASRARQGGSLRART